MKRLTDIQIANLMPSEIFPVHDEALYGFANAIIDEFCRINGITGEAQPARQWVGLTDEEIETIRQGVVSDFIAAVADKRRGTMSVQTMARAIESKLREKNAGQPVADDKAGGEPVDEGLCKECAGAGVQRYMTYGRGPDDYEYDADCETCRGTGSSDIRDVIKSLPYQPHTVKTGVQMVDRAEVLRVIDAYTHPQPQAEVRVPDQEARFKAQHQFLEWNRQQDGQLVEVAYEYFVFNKAIDLYLAAAAQKPQDDLPAILKKQAS